MSQVAKSASAFVRAFLAILVLELEDMVVRLVRPPKLAGFHGSRWTVRLGAAGRLARRRTPTVVYGPTIDRRIQERFAGDTLRFMPEPAELDPIQNAITQIVGVEFGSHAVAGQQNHISLRAGMLKQLAHCRVEFLVDLFDRVAHDFPLTRVVLRMRGIGQSPAEPGRDE